MSSRWLPFVVAVLALVLGFGLGRRFPGGDPPAAGALAVERVGDQIRLTATAPDKVYVVVSEWDESPPSSAPEPNDQNTGPVIAGDSSLLLTPPAVVYELQHVLRLSESGSVLASPCRGKHCIPPPPPDPPYLIYLSGSQWGPLHKPVKR